MSVTFSWASMRYECSLISHIPFVFVHFENMTLFSQQTLHNLPHFFRLVDFICVVLVYSIAVPLMFLACFQLVKFSHECETVLKQTVMQARETEPGKYGELLLIEMILKQEKVHFYLLPGFWCFVDLLLSLF